MPITVAIPFYNAEKYLADSIRSVFAQTYQDWELILIDDGSSDRSLDIARSVSDSRVVVISDGKNKKLAARLNEITILAKYEYIARMDADDMMAPNRLEVLLEILENEPKIDLVSSGLFSILNDKTLISCRGVDCEEFSHYDFIYKRKGFLHAGLLARRSWYKRNQYDESMPLAEDTELWIRASASNDFNAVTIKTPLYIYREEESITARKIVRACQVAREKITPYIESPLKRRVYIIKTYLRSAVVVFLDFFKIIHILQKRRNPVPLTPDVAKAYLQALKVINSVKVPGLDG